MNKELSKYIKGVEGNHKDIRIDKLKKILMEHKGTLSSAMRKAGYNEGYIKSNGIKKTKTFKEMEKSLLQKLEEKENILIDGITEQKAKKESNHNLSGALKNVNHVKQVVSGGATDRVEYVITAQEEEENTE